MRRREKAVLLHSGGAQPQRETHQVQSARIAQSEQSHHAVGEQLKD